MSLTENQISGKTCFYTIASRNYELRMSKSSDSITAAKLLAMKQQQGKAQGLRINQDMSKSMEKQIDVYTKTRDDIRKILQVHRQLHTEHSEFLS